MKKPMIMVQLREQTRAYHDRLESHSDLLQRMNTISDYRRVLERFYGIYTPLERQLAEVFRQSKSKAGALDFEKRRKSALLVADLRTLGVPGERLQHLPCMPSLPALSTLPQAYGCLYVLEGATLGGQILSRHVKKALGLDAGNGAAFFNSYGTEIGRMWREFGDILTAYTALHDDEEQIITSACETFAAFAGWLVKGEEAHAL
jgi:heme oxygenase